MSSAARDARPESFSQAAPAALANAQVRANIRHATGSIRTKRAALVAEVPDWEALREAAAAIKDATLSRLDEVLVELEASVETAGGVVHWARDAAEANEIVTALVRAEGADEVVKVKSLATDEIRLNETLEAAGIRPIETDLAELIIQLADERPSHLLVPAIHKNRVEIRDLFRARLGRPDLSDDPGELAEAARLHLREAFLRARVAISGANFAAADTGTICVVESEGNGRMRTTLPETLITVMGIEKAIPRFRDLEVFLQLCPLLDRRADEPVHLALDGRPRRRRSGAVPPRAARCRAHARARRSRRPAGAPLHPLLGLHQRVPGLPPDRRACVPLAVCRADRGDPRPTARGRERGGGVAAVRLVALRRLLRRVPGADRHPVDPRPRAGKVGRARAARHRGRSLKLLGRAFATRAGYERAQRLGRSLQRPVARNGWITHFPPGPLAAWGRARDLPALPAQTFREWWESRDRA